MMMGLTVAILIGAPLGTWAGNLLGWQIAFAGVGGIALLTALLIRLYVPVQPIDTLASPVRAVSAA
ncbi:hypothetical protein HORIV_72350 [Vreelandella olivaria]|uniref:Major facilitator superfamily (MFS) profile domain-containing protein n=1 Tax=Vreelandella olivaria TaxID=390919 RepID=A0ABN5X6E5_9GAMM|nr:hypothetical protein HORIV_72350 [Halomonas olivaria]